VEDFGQGISEKDQKRVFDRFYRIDKARSRETGGTGLGLPIAKAIITAHRGNLTVESILGRGTVFTIQLPIS
jgi:two-component system, OmpR family, sensor histidine kinase ArlS